VLFVKNIEWAKFQKLDYQTDSKRFALKKGKILRGPLKAILTQIKKKKTTDKPLFFS
jgi:hypothetical protein